MFHLKSFICYSQCVVLLLVGSAEFLSVFNRQLDWLQLVDCPPIIIKPERRLIPFALNATWTKRSNEPVQKSQCEHFTEHITNKGQRFSNFEKVALLGWHDSVYLSWLEIRYEDPSCSVWKIENQSRIRLPNPIRLYFPPRHRQPIICQPLLWIEKLIHNLPARCRTDK